MQQEKKYQIWLSVCLIKIGEVIFRKPQIKKTKELESTLLIARRPEFSEKEMEIIQNVKTQ